MRKKALKKIISVVGARPQFVKVKPIADEFTRASIPHKIVHTGQHYDYAMSKLFFDQLHIPQPHYHLNVGRETPNIQTAKIISGLEKILEKERPSLVLVYGDTTSTLAGCLAAVNRKIPVGHVEAGLRSYRIDMPEEINRRLTDQMATLRFCPTQGAVSTLKKERLGVGSYFVGDVMYDIFKSQTKHISLSILQRLKLKPRDYLLLTLHRQQNVDQADHLRLIIGILASVPWKIIFPVHPRTKKMMHQLPGFHFQKINNIHFINPVSYLDMLALEKYASKILTDSGGVQKEAYFWGVPCVTLRDETEWPETIAAGRNILTGTNQKKILSAIRKLPYPKNSPNVHPRLFGSGNAANQIVKLALKSIINNHP
jgi:UDP-GlcNAc3NAcA epimerase